MRPRSLLVAALLVLAGCSGLGPTGPGSNEPTDTVTPAPVPNTDGVSSTGGDRLAPGLTADGIVNETALDRAHRSGLENRSFVRRTRGAVVYGNGSVYDSFVARRTVDDRNGTVLEVRNWSSRWGPSNLSRVTRWTNGTTRAVRRVYHNGSTEYEFHREQSSDVRAGVGSPVSFLHRHDATPRSERTVDDTTEYLLVADGVTDVPLRRYGSVEQTGEGRLLAVVTEDGIVRRARIRAPLRIGAADGRYVLEDEYVLDEGSVGRPDWVTTAAERDGAAGDASTTRTPSDA